MRMVIALALGLLAAVASVRAEEGHAFEVVVKCKDNLVAHLTSCLLVSEAVAEVTVVAPQKTILNDLKALVAAEGTLFAVQNRITFEAVATLMRELWP